jgi:hypothetical protein
MNRRTFVASLAAPLVAAQAGDTPAGTPWFRRTFRWGQTNITEIDPTRYDIPWWREFWKRTAVQGVIINAGGIVAYYPSKFPLQHQAEFLQGRDLYGELCGAAQSDGLAVLARMDSNRTAEDFYRAHPDWFTRSASGEPYRAADKYITCVNSPYYEQYLPDVLREIIGRTHPSGITDNSWSGLDRGRICFCDNCARRFRERTGHPLPKAADWDSPVYRQWIEWNYARRLELWDFNNRVTKDAGGADCLWLGMNSGSVTEQAHSFRDCARLWKRAEILMLDYQARGSFGFEENSDAGKRIHGVMGWNKLIPESMPMYQAGGKTWFRVASKPAAEAHLWMLEGFAGGVQPWWHYISAYQEDRRMYHTPGPVMRWHRENERYLLNRRPIATVGLAWSQRNTDFYGRSEAREMVELPYRGFQHALIRARIPYVPVELDQIGEASGVRTLILPNIAALSDAHASALRGFVNRGGALIATGATGLYDEHGDPRSDFALADLFGAHVTTRPGEERKWAAQSLHSYLRLTPELRAKVWGPQTGKEPAIHGVRHPIFKGFEETDILPFGGMLAPLRLDDGAETLLTLVPPFPVFPPETAWMREPVTSIPGLILNGRMAYLPADLDRRYAQDGLPDHGELLANLTRWSAGEHLPLRVEGRGLVDCNLYAQPGRMILHLVNLANSAGRGPVDEILPIGPLRVSVRFGQDSAPKEIRLLVSGSRKPSGIEGQWASFTLDRLEGHEVAVLE